MANSIILFTPKRRLAPPDASSQLVLNTSLTTDNITSLVVTTTIPGGTPATGYLLMVDDLGNYRRLHYSSFAGSTFTIDTTDGNEDFATTNATAGVWVWITDLNPFDFYQLDITMTSLEKSDDDKVSEVTTMSGQVIKSFYYSTRNYACSVLMSGYNGEPTAAEYEMFFASVKAGENFAITNPDENNATITAQLIGSPSRSRLSNNYVGQFTYSFNFREVI